jgi:septum site-determining protein MinD
MGREMTGDVYAVIGGRGGTGTTTTVVALGASLAETSHRVAVVDADFESEGITARLDLPDEGATLQDVLQGDADLDAALADGPHGLQVLPSDAAPPEPTDVRSHALVRAADAVREQFDAVFVDLGAGGGVSTAVVLDRVGDVVLTTTHESDAVAATADAATVARHHGATVLGTVLTQVPTDATLDSEALSEVVGTDLLALVPDDRAVPESALAGASLLRHDPDSEAAMVYWELAARLDDGDAVEQPVVPRRADDSTTAVAESGANAAQTDATTEPERADATTESERTDATTGPERADATTGPERADATTESERADATTKSERTDASAESGCGATTPSADESSAAGSRTSEGETASVDGASASVTEAVDSPDADVETETPSDDDSNDKDEEMEAAFKQTMEKVRKEREAKEDADENDSDEKGLFDGLIG